MLNVYVRTQVKCAGGRTDMVVWMPDTTYVFELKVSGTAQEALDQINSRGYALPYPTDGRRVVKVGVLFDRQTMTVGDCSTTHMVCNASESIIIPAGTYDFFITNPTPGDRIWRASTNGNIGGRVNDFVFEAGNTYEFHVYYGGSNDATDVTITGANAGAKGNNHKPTKANNSAMAVDCRTK